MIEALCVPEIKIKFNLPGLQEFVLTGHKLADEFLLEGKNKIENIKFILRTNASFFVPESNVIFGKSNLSNYSETPNGILLFGNVDNLKQNLIKIPFKNCKKIVDFGVSMCSVNRRERHEVCQVDIRNEDAFSILDDKGKIIE